MVHTDGSKSIVAIFFPRNEHLQSAPSMAYKEKRTYCIIPEFNVYSGA